LIEQRNRLYFSLLHSVWLERNKKERVKEERNRRETLYFSCSVSREKEKREDCSVGPTQNLFLLSTAKKVERNTLVIFLSLFCPSLFSFRGKLSRVSTPPSFFILLGHYLPHSSSKFGDWPAISFDLFFLDLYNTTSNQIWKLQIIGMDVLNLFNVFFFVQYRWIYHKMLLILFKRACITMGVVFLSNFWNFFYDVFLC